MSDADRTPREEHPLTKLVQALAIDAARRDYERMMMRLAGRRGPRKRVLIPTEPGGPC